MMDYVDFAEWRLLLLALYMVKYNTDINVVRDQAGRLDTTLKFG